MRVSDVVLSFFKGHTSVFGLTSIIQIGRPACFVFITKDPGARMGGMGQQHSDQI